MSKDSRSTMMAHACELKDSHHFLKGFNANFAKR